MTKILVIEDQESLREEVLYMLGLEGFEARGAENGQIGIQTAREYQPDLILCDVIMPGLDGYGVLTQLRQDSATVTIPFIFLTGRADKSALRRGMRLGADDYLIKPFTRTELLEAIATQFKKQEALEQQAQQKLNALRSSITLSLPHELHTPLAGIISMSELLIEDYGLVEAEDGLEMLETIRSSAERLYRMTQNFLLYAELELMAADAARVNTLRQSRISSHTKITTVESAVQVAQKAGRAEDLQIELQDAVVLMSELKLKKVVEELIDNAIKFSAPGTLIQVTSAIENEQFVLQVTDQGRGMTPEQVANIGAYMQFERKLHEQQGSGLGLVIAKRLVELQGGALTIESVPGIQTIVRVVLQICEVGDKEPTER